MTLPRCGVKDKVGFGTDSRSKRYALQGSRWKVKALTYRISKYPKRLNKPDVDKEIAKAFSVWSEYTDLTFTPKRTNPVHIEIRWVVCRILYSWWFRVKYICAVSINDARDDDKNSYLFCIIMTFFCTIPIHGDQKIITDDNYEYYLVIIFASSFNSCTGMFFINLWYYDWS